MHGTYLSQRVIWSTWGVAFTGVFIAQAGWKTAGVAIWLAAVALQWFLGISVLLRRRKVRRARVATD